MERELGRVRVAPILETGATPTRTRRQRQRQKGRRRQQRRRLWLRQRRWRRRGRQRRRRRSREARRGHFLGGRGVVGERVGGVGAGTRGCATHIARERPLAIAGARELGCGVVRRRRPLAAPVDFVLMLALDVGLDSLG